MSSETAMPSEPAAPSEAKAPPPAEPTFKNSTGQPLLIETWVRAGDGLNSTHMTRVNPGAEIPIPASITGEWIVYLTAGFYRFGKFRREPCASGNRAWAEYDHPYRTHDIAYIAENDACDPYFVAWKCPSAGPSGSD